MGICCMSQGTQTRALKQPTEVGWGGRWERGSIERGHTYTYGWFMLRFDRKQQNSVNQLSFNKKIKRKKTKKNPWLSAWYIFGTLRKQPEGASKKGVTKSRGSIKPGKGAVVISMATSGPAKTSLWGSLMVSPSLIAQLVKNPPAMQETLVWFLDQEDLLEKG